MSDKYEINRVRQILMNELGLSREYIREELKILIKEEIEKILDDAFGKGKLENLIYNETNKRLNTYNDRWYGRDDAFQKEILNELRRQAADYFENNIELIIGQKDESKRIKRPKETVREPRAGTL